jgi:hypothetical protein
MSDDPARILCVYTTCTMCALSHPIRGAQTRLMCGRRRTGSQRRGGAPRTRGDVPGARGRRCDYASAHVRPSGKSEPLGYLGTLGVEIYWLNLRGKE